MHTAERVTHPELQYDAEHRRYYDTVTWLAEVLPGSMRTPFEYRFDGHELYAEDGGALRPIFEDAMTQAEQLPVYEQRRRRIEFGEYEDMLAMARGELPNTMVVLSDFPPELMEAEEDIGGYNVARKQTMLRVITRTSDGKIKMLSQSLDKSDRTALEAIYTSLGFEAQPGEFLGQRMHLKLDEYDQEFLIDQLMGVYDRTLGPDYYAGIQYFKKQNTYEFVREQQDLLQAYLVTTNGFTGGDADYNLAAAVRARYLNRDGLNHGIVSMYHQYQGSAIAAHALALAEMDGAGSSARREGVVVSGCGKTISAQGTSDTAEQLQQSGFGNQADKRLPDDKFGSRYFVCPNKGCKYENTRPKDTLIPRCKKCGTDVSCNESAKTNSMFRQIIEKSFGKQDTLRKEEA